MSDTYSQGCPIAIALDVIGDRWMLLCSAIWRTPR